MATEVILPKLGMNMESAKIVRWLKHEGDQVAVGDVLAEVETDKTVTDLESEGAGVLRRLLVAEGQEVAVSQTLAVIAGAGEDITGLLDRAAQRTDDHAHVARVYDAWRPAPTIGAAPGLSGANGTHGVDGVSGNDAVSLPVALSGPGGSAAPNGHAAGSAPRGAPADVAGIRARLGLHRGSRAAAQAPASVQAPPSPVVTPPARSIVSAVTAVTAQAAQAAQAAAVTAVAATRPQRLVIYGAGLGAKQLLEITRLLDGIVVLGLIDDSAELAGAEIAGLPVLGGQAALGALVLSGQVDGVALSFHSDVRRKVHRRLRDELGVSLVALVDPRAIVGAGVQVGAGALIEAGAIVGPDTFVGEGAIVDVGAVVAHDCFIGPFSHLSPGCRLSGVVSLAENVLVGVGASINSTVTVGCNVIIAPGAAVMNDVPDGVVVSGVPAKVIGQSRRGA